MHRSERNVFFRVSLIGSRELRIRYVEESDEGGPQRPVISGDVANLFFKESCGRVELLHTDRLSDIMLRDGSVLSFASSDVL